MKIGVLGTGNVGATLGLRWASLGHDVTFGSRDPNSEKVRGVLAQSENKVKADHIKKAVQACEVIVLAIPWHGVKDVLKEGDFRKKIVIDCTNPLKSDFSGSALVGETSAAEEIAKQIKGAYLVKAFNSIGSMVMADPSYGKDKAMMLICSDHADAKAVVKTLAEQLDFEVVDAGDLVIARYLEKMAVLWIHLAFKQNLGANFAFKLLKR